MAKSGEDTPLLKQYFSIKAQHPEALLLYRVGDFYETYSDDALLASKVLGLVLTRRSNGDKGSTEMAGFPHHALESYLQKIVRAGYKVAICDQLEDPNLVKTKLVKRGVTEILTPGIAFGEGMLESSEHNYLAGLNFDGPQCGAAFLDVSTGTFKVAQGSIEYISTLLSSFRPKELVVERDVFRTAKEKFSDYYVTPLDEWAFVQSSAEEKLRGQLKVSSLKGFAIDRYPLAVCAAGALVAYLEQTQHSGLGNICSISRIDENRFVWMDRFTFRNLEIFQSNAGKDGVSLVDTIDRCCSPMGSRLLREWLAMPLMEPARLEERYEVVQLLLDNAEMRGELQNCIRGVGDLERIISRASTGKILPREVRQLGRSLEQMEPISSLCSGTGVAALEKMASGMKDTGRLKDLIKSTLAEDAASMIGKGDVIAPGVDAQLDELREISRGGKDFLAKMQAREIERTGINSLKIGYNNVFGYYIEVRNAARDKVPQEWIRKQTLVSAERYITPELKEYEEQILGAEAKIYEIESRLFSELIASIQKSVRDIQQNCGIISTLDVLQGFAQQAEDRDYCRPVVDKSSSLEIVAGRHPVIETLMEAGEEYVPNDIRMDSKGEQIIILTGPNMAGKSALLRQTALIVLLAQIGSFVPARSARFGYFDKIFTRVGATDNISRGESTFMVEMLETSMIMHNLSARSLVLLDEIGRGTSTYDGMSIARALVEYIHNSGKGAKTLFATHYHELNDLEQQYPRVKNYHIAIKEDGHNIIFLRKLEPGGVAHSFGIHVARLAGMPREVIDSAERTLRQLELREKRSRDAEISEDGSMQLSIFQLDDPTLSSLKAKLEKADLNNMTPLQAFDLLREMKAEVGA
ncbi:MAG: DNA mismatch repair protein MutS [Candidatus Cryptobacteroides sp.]|nr:DNA mismatch repair protein MutS [Rikenellaceae bacterium]MDY5746235.1 DNA mismatch repair protein MutS [Candidatus Cryptobacteroides sp.]